MGGSPFLGRADPWAQAPSAFAAKTCFPYGGATRIRFEGFRDGSCPNLSPEPRARLNEAGSIGLTDGGFASEKQRADPEIARKTRRVLRYADVSSLILRLRADVELQRGEDFLLLGVVFGLGDELLVEQRFELP